MINLLPQNSSINSINEFSLSFGKLLYFIQELLYILFMVLMTKYVFSLNSIELGLFCIKVSENFSDIKSINGSFI